MGAPPILDTNILVYALSSDPRATKAQELLAAPFVISVQSLNEFANVGRRKLGLQWGDIRNAIADIVELAEVVLDLDLDAHVRALELAENHGLSIYDALILVVGEGAGCPICYSEDMHHGLTLRSGLKIVNPFL